ncbi:hypothetical protein ABVT39_009937 [Epinephelus coioides]
MQFFGALILFMTLSAACGLRCYTCTATDPYSCTAFTTCPATSDRCFSLREDGYFRVTRGCQTSSACEGAMVCCMWDLCNGAMLFPPRPSLVSVSVIPTGPSVFFLLVSSAIITIFP